MTHSDSLRHLDDNRPGNSDILDLYLKAQFNSGSDDDPLAAATTTDDYSFVDTIEAFAAQADSDSLLRFGQNIEGFTNNSTLPTLFTADFDRPVVPLIPSHSQQQQRQQQQQKNLSSKDEKLLVSGVERAKPACSDNSSISHSPNFLASSLALPFTPASPSFFDGTFSNEAMATLDRQKQVFSLTDHNNNSSNNNNNSNSNNSNNNNKNNNNNHYKQLHLQIPHIDYGVHPSNDLLHSPNLTAQLLLHPAHSPTAPEITVEVVDPPTSGLSPYASDFCDVASPVLFSPSISDSDHFEQSLYPPRAHRSLSSVDIPTSSFYLQANNSNLSVSSAFSEFSVPIGSDSGTPNNQLLTPQFATGISKSPRSRSNSRVGSSAGSRSPSADPEKARSRSLSASREYILELASNTPGSKKAQRHPSVFACDMCDKRFTRAYNLRSHKRTHTNERPYVCSFCPKAFARQHDRKRHEALHSGEKKYECRGVLADGITPWGCGHRFARPDALGRHFRTEAGKECIRELIQEAEREKLEKSIIKVSGDAPGLTLSGVANDDAVENTDIGDLPEALLLQFPMLLDKSKS